MPWLGQKIDKTNLDYLMIPRSKEVIQDFEGRGFRDHKQPGSHWPGWDNLNISEKADCSAP